MSSQEAVVYSKEDLALLVSNMWKGRAISVKWVIIGDKRSLTANGLYWMWLSKIADSFNKRLKTEFTKDDMHYLMRAKHLGTEDIVIGKTVIESQLKSTKRLEVGPFCEYMTKIEVWSIGHGIILPHPPANEYTEYWQSQQ